ncbi:DUF2794 domain-containing protein [Roseiterribacter gracilis]|uniref:DUF2794 domain-containing protein n=1 Tax=Roseiterribacter gracilis TaxID=2812848 RepID=UPI003B438F22
MIQLDPPRHKAPPAPIPPIGFTRVEMARILDLYSRRVMAGAWRDYAIDNQADQATFSIFRHAADRPLFTVAKRQVHDMTEYSVFEGPAVLASGPDLDETLAALAARPFLVRS